MAIENALKPAPLSASIVHHTDPFLPIDRAAKALERNIQAFLDAQSEGLSAGLGSGAQDDFSSNGSLTPTPSTSTPHSLARPKIIPVRQPQKKRISLTGARKGLAKSMKEFVLVKQEEIKVLNEEEIRREQALRSVDLFETKRAGLKDQIAKIQNEAGTRHVNSLKAEAENLESEIKRLEDELAEKRARHRHLINQANQTENSVQSKLSSFEASLKMLDSEIKTFLKRPPIEQSLQAGEHHAVSAGDFYTINPKRRTLDLAKDHWVGEGAMLRDRKQDVAAEIAALKAGSDIWRRIVTEINDFEKWLQKETRELSNIQPAGPIDMSSALTRMDGLIDLLEQQYQFAEENGWNLLLCCIGAELEAFREGKALLSRTLGLVQENGDGGSQGTPESELIEYGGANETDQDLGGSNESLKATLLAMDGANDEPLQGIVMSQGPGADSRSESEDEGPGPDFLISHE
jgi:cell division protein FtsB